MPHEWYSNGTKFRPKFRGVFHQIAFAASPILAANIFQLCKSGEAVFVTIMFMLGFSSHFGFSYVFHRWNLKLENEILMSKLDHAGVFLMMIGCYTPASLILDSPVGFLVSLYAIGTICILLSFFPKYKVYKKANVILCLATGALISPYLPELFAIYTLWEKYLQIIGLVAYVIGALIYAFRWPSPWLHFGYHEIFHAFTIIGAMCAYLLVYSLLDRKI